MDYRIFNVCTDVNARDCTREPYGHCKGPDLYQIQSYDPISYYRDSVERTNEIAYMNSCLVARLSQVVDSTFKRIFT